MANSAGICLDFKVQLLCAKHAFATGARTKDTFNAALFATTASRSNADTAYNTTGELTTSGNYTQGGVTVPNTNAPALDGANAHWTPSGALAWNNFTSSANFNCMVLYNFTQSANNEVAVFTFGDQGITSGNFSLTMPTDNGTTGLIRIA